MLIKLMNNHNEKKLDYNIYQNWDYNIVTIEQAYSNFKNVIVSQFDHNKFVVNLWYANSLNLISWLGLRCW